MTSNRQQLQITFALTSRMNRNPGLGLREQKHTNKEKDRMAYICRSMTCGYRTGASFRASLRCPRCGQTMDEVWGWSIGLVHMDDSLQVILLCLEYNNIDWNNQWLLVRESGPALREQGQINKESDRYGIAKSSSWWNYWISRRHNCLRANIWCL